MHAIQFGVEKCTLQFFWSGNVSTPNNLEWILVYSKMFQFLGVHSFAHHFFWSAKIMHSKKQYDHELLFVNCTSNVDTPKFMEFTPKYWCTIKVYWRMLRTHPKNKMNSLIFLYQKLECIHWVLQFFCHLWSVCFFYSKIFWSAPRVHFKKFEVHTSPLHQNWSVHQSAPKTAKFWSGKLFTSKKLEWTTVHSKPIFLGWRWTHSTNLVFI